MRRNSLTLTQFLGNNSNNIDLQGLHMSKAGGLQKKNKKNGSISRKKSTVVLRAGCC